MEADSWSKFDNLFGFSLAPLDGITSVFDTELEDVVTWHQGFLWNEEVSVVQMWVHLHEFEKVLDGLVVFLDCFVSVVILNGHWHHVSKLNTFCMFLGKVFVLFFNIFRGSEVWKVVWIESDGINNYLFREFDTW